MIEIFCDQINGSDENPGTKERPVRTPEAAMKLVPESWNGGVRIIGVGELADELSARMDQVLGR